MSLVSVAEVQARNVGAELSASALQDAIDAAEAYLARYIGPLSGERTETFYPRRGSEPLYLRRAAPSVVVTDAGTVLDLGEEAGEYRLLYSGTVIELVFTSWTTTVYGTGTVTVTYTPDDEAEVQEAVIDLVRLNLADGPYTGERIGEYSYQRSQSAGFLNAARHAIIRRLQPQRPYRSERIVAATV